MEVGSVKTEDMQEAGFVGDCGRYMAISGILMVVGILYNAIAGDESYGFWGSIVIMIFYTVVPAIGAAIGNLLRKIAMPLFIVTNGGMGGLLKARAFWAFGPQVIGWICGAMLATEMLSKWFGMDFR